MRRLILCLILLIALTATACGQKSSTVALAPPTAQPTAVETVTDTTSFADALRASGVMVAAEGSVAQEFLQVEGTILRVDDQRLQVYEYPDPAAARADAARFPPDGAWVNGDIGATLVNWIATPHLFQTSRLITVYVGDHRRR
jgi:hypothetical protein